MAPKKRDFQISIARDELALLAADATAGARGSVPDGTALERLAVYLELLVRWNAAFNLVGFRKWQDIFIRLVADSFYLAAFLSELALPAEPQTWDLGSGAGLPGIPLRLMWTEGTYHMVERREKRALFLSTALARLDLPRTFVFRGSVEDFFASRHPPRHKADAIVSRAFLPWATLLELARPRLCPGGRLLVLTSEREPEGLPASWTLTAARAYAVAGKNRYFWALSPKGS